MNTSAAFEFLRQMEDRRNREERAAESESSEPQKIVFKNSTKLCPKHDDDNDGESGTKEKIIGNKFVMKEYVIGEKRKSQKGKKLPRVISSSSKQLKLSHLDDDEEEDE